MYCLTLLTALETSLLERGQVHARALQEARRAGDHTLMMKHHHELNALVKPVMRIGLQIDRLEGMYNSCQV